MGKTPVPDSGETGSTPVRGTEEHNGQGFGA